MPATFRGPQQGDANPLPGSNEAFRMERSACSLFGVTTFGVHCTGERNGRRGSGDYTITDCVSRTTAYVEEQDDQPMRIWVPKRSPNKQT